MMMLSNTTGATSGAGTAYPSGTPLSGVHVAQSEKFACRNKN